MALPKLHKTNPAATVGHTVVIKRRHVERMFPQSIDYHLTNQATIVRAEPGGGISQISQRQRMLGKLGEGCFCAPAAGARFRAAAIE